MCRERKRVHAFLIGTSILSPVCNQLPSPVIGRGAEVRGGTLKMHLTPTPLPEYKGGAQIILLRRERQVVCPRRVEQFHEPSLGLRVRSARIGRRRAKCVGFSLTTRAIASVSSVTQSAFMPHAMVHPRARFRQAFVRAHRQLASRGDDSYDENHRRRAAGFSA